MILHIIGIYTYLLNFCSAFGRKKSKWIALLLLLIMYVLMVATNNMYGENGDYSAYLELYDHFKNGGTINSIQGYKSDYGYMLLMIAISKLGISYNMFLSIMTIICIYMIYSTVSKITKNYNLILVLYALFPFFYDVFQFRFFLSYSIVVFAMKYIIFEENISYKKYIFYIILASIFHETALFFFIYIILKLKIKDILNLSFVVSLLITILCFIANINIINIIMKFIKIKKFGNYNSQAIGYELNPLVSLFVIGIILLFIYIMKIIYYYNPSYTNKYVFWINKINIFLLPFLLITLDIERFIRPILLVNYAIVAKEYKNIPKNKRILLICSMIIVIFIRQYLMLGITQVILRNNYIVDYLLKAMYY